MIFPPPLTALFLSLAAWLGTGSEAPRAPLRGVLVGNDSVIHVPIAQRRRPRFEWVERKGPKCVPVAMIAGAAMATPSTIDILLRDRRRLRARLDSDCAGLDFYGGFYVEPRDGAVCARRDEIRSRAGSTCRIDRFRSLHPNFKR